jgi:site-specific recombinase XerD
MSSTPDASTTAATTATVWHLLPERWQHRTLRSKSLSPLTVRGYLSTARRWADWLVEQGYDLEPDEVEDFHIEEFIGDIVEATSAANAAFHYRNLRVYFGWLVKRKEITPGRPNPMDATEPPNVPEKLVPIITDNEHDRMLATCTGRGFFALRDIALLSFFKDTGARVSEVARLDIDDLMLNERLAKVTGKGNKQRLVAYSADTTLALVRYLKARKKYAEKRGVSTSRLWLAQWARPLAVDGVKRVVRHRGELAGLSIRAHAHRYRHTYAHNWKLNQGSTEGLMATGGWSNSKMPEHYGKIARASRALAEQQRIMLGQAS